MKHKQVLWVMICCLAIQVSSCLFDKCRGKKNAIKEKIVVKTNNHYEKTDNELGISEYQTSVIPETMKEDKMKNQIELSEPIEVKKQFIHDGQSDTKRELVDALLLHIYGFCGPSTQIITYLIFRFLDAPLSASRTIQAHTQYVTACQLSWDNHLLVSSGKESVYPEESRNTLKLWNVEDGSLKHNLEYPGHLLQTTDTCLFTSDDQRLITAGSVGPALIKLTTIRLWCVPTGTLLHSFEFQDSIFACLLSSDDKFFLCSEDTPRKPTIQMWSLETFTCAKIFKGHTDQIMWLQFRNSDQEVLSSSNDKTIRLWSV